MRNKVLVPVCLMVTLCLIAPVVSSAAEDESNMMEMAKTWEMNYNAGDLAAVAELYAEDGCRMPPNTEMVWGREAIHKALELGMEQGIAQVKIEVKASESSGDMAHAMGTYKILDGEGAEVDHGKWMNVSKKKDGEWKIHCDIFNSDMPLPGADE